ncbi:MAG: cation:dicarboxylase symporter family transporter [Candidatus Aureabacteria bacterium]|nr:cation:dicarboxylase symporter family transporter [Candidatus Auribacterota bacterium]
MRKTVQILAGLAAGVLCGLFFGDMCRVLEPVGTAFIKLMQMAVIPYVVVSLIGSIGDLNKSEAKKVARKGGLLLVSLWILGIVIFFSMQFAFPPRMSASFYSAGEVTRPEPVNLVDTFIPANPFRALADGILPAIVLFSVFLGVALIGAKEKKPLLDILGILTASLSRIMGFIMAIVPYGVFAVTAHAVGTLSFETLYLLQFFCESYLVLNLVLIFAVLPLFLSLFTGFRYRDIIYACGGALVLSFSAQKTFIALPLIERGVRELFAKDQAGEAKAGTYAEVLLPIAYNFPTYGDFAPFLFVIFVGWLYDAPLSIARQLHCALAGVFSFFGSSKAAVPFLLTLARLPEDAYELYISSSALNSHFGAALSCMFLFSFTAACVALLSGAFRVRLRRVVSTAAVLIVVLATAIAGLRLGFSHLLRGAYRGDEAVAGKEMPTLADGTRISDTVSAKVYRTIEEFRSQHPHGDDDSHDVLERIKDRGALRVGYNEDALPFAFFNKKRELVGYDAQMAYELASFMGVQRVEFIPIIYGELDEALNSGRCDIIMAGAVITPERLKKMKFSSSHMTSHLAFVVPDYRKDEFSSLEDVRERNDVTIAVMKGTASEEILPHLFPRARVVRLDADRDFFSGKKGDALLTTEEEGAPWTLLYPFYRVAAFGPHEGAKYLHAYPVAMDSDESFLRFVNAFLDMQRAHGALQQKYEYWVLGKNPYRKRQRWSVIRDVLHWVK